MQRLHSICRAALVVCLAVLTLATAGYAVSPVGWTDYILSEDVNYWVYSAQTLQVYTTDDYDSIPASDTPLVKVQQTVYNQDYTALLKGWRLIPSEVTGYLYAYSVSNLNVLKTIDAGTNQSSGITEFHVNWAVNPITVTTAPETPADWDPFYLSTGPTWMYRGTGSGMLPGETVGGLWAFANTGNDKVTSATVKAGLVDMTVISGDTTGPDPLPEPSGLVALLCGTVGLLGYGIRSIRK